MVYNMLVTLRERCNLNSSSFSPLSYIARRSVRLIGRFAFCFIGGGERHVFPLRLSSALNRVRLCTLIRALGNCCENPHHSPPPLAGNCAVAPVYSAYRRRCCENPHHSPPPTGKPLIKPSPARGRCQPKVDG